MGLPSFLFQQNKIHPLSALLPERVDRFLSISTRVVSAVCTGFIVCDYTIILSEYSENVNMWK